MTTATKEAALSTTDSNSTPAKAKNPGGRPKGYDPALPLSTTPAMTKVAVQLPDAAMAELSKLNTKLSKHDQSVADLLVLLQKTEAVSQSLFAAASVRWLQRGMLLAELMAACQREGNSWTDFYPDQVQPITNISKRSEEGCRTLWRRWLECNDQGYDPQALLTASLGVYELTDALKLMVEGEDAEDAVEQVKKKKGPGNGGDSLQRIRTRGRKLQQDVVKTGETANDPHLRGLLSKLADVLSALDEYYEARDEGVPVVATTVNEVDADNALEAAISDQLEVAAG